MGAMAFSQTAISAFTPDYKADEMVSLEDLASLSDFLEPGDKKVENILDYPEGTQFTFSDFP